MQEHALQVRRTARFYTLGEVGPELRQLWIVCHGYGQLARDFLRVFGAIAAPDRLIVAPEALNRFYLDTRIAPHGPQSPVGGTWMTREDRLHDIDDYVAYLDDVHTHIRMSFPPAVTPTLFVLGFSQGVATVCRWASRTSATIDQLILWAGSLPPELAPTPDLFGTARLTIVTGDAEASTGEAIVTRQRERLDRGGLRADFVRFGGGHHLDRTLLRQIAEGLGSASA